MYGNKKRTTGTLVRKTSFLGGKDRLEQDDRVEEEMMNQYGGHQDQESTNEQDLVNILLRCNLKNNNNLKFAKLGALGEEQCAEDDGKEEAKTGGEEFEDDDFMDWSKFDGLKIERRRNSIRRMSNRGLDGRRTSSNSYKKLGDDAAANGGEEEEAEEIEEGEKIPSFQQKKMRAMRLLRVMAHLCGPSEPSSSQKQKQGTKNSLLRDCSRKDTTIRAIGSCEVNSRSATLSVLKKEFYRITKNPTVMADNLKLVCCDPVNETESDVVTTTFLRFLLQKHVEGLKDRQKLTVSKVLSDFSNCLASNPCDETIHALVGISMLMNNEYNSKLVAWDTVINDEVLRGILDVFNQANSDKATSKLNVIRPMELCIQAVVAIWSLSNNSFLLRSRLAALGGTYMLSRFLGDEANRKYADDEEKWKFLHFSLGAMVSLSLDSQSQQDLWENNLCVPFLQYVIQELKVAKEATASKGMIQFLGRLESHVFHLVRNSSTELRKVLESSTILESQLKEISSLLATMLEICGSNKSETSKHLDENSTKSVQVMNKGRVLLMVRVLANISSSFAQLFTGDERCIDIIFSCISCDVGSKLDSQDTERHFYQCAVLILSSLMKLPKVMERACDLMLQIASAWEFKFDPESLQSFCLEGILDSLVLLDGKRYESETTPIHLGENLIQRIAKVIQSKVASGCAASVRSGAFNIARLRYFGNQESICKELVRIGVISNLLDSMKDPEWESDTRLCLQITSALITLKCYVHLNGLDVPNFEKDGTTPTLEDQVMQVIKQFAAMGNNDGEDWLKDSTVVSSCATLAWNIPSKTIITNGEYVLLLQSMASSYFNSSKPVWGLSIGTLCRSLFDYFDHNIKGGDEQGRNLTLNCVDFLVHQLKHCGGMLQTQARNGGHSHHHQQQHHNRVTGQFGSSSSTMSKTGKNRKLMIDENERARLEAMIIQPPPYGANQMLKTTEKLMYEFIAGQFEKEQEEFEKARLVHKLEEEVKEECDQVDNASCAENNEGVDEGGHEKLQQPHVQHLQEEDDGSKDSFLLLSIRANASLEMLLCILERVHQFEWAKEILNFLRNEAMAVLFYIGEHSRQSIVRGNSAKVLWALLESVEMDQYAKQNTAEVLRFASCVVGLFSSRGQEEIGAILASRLIQTLTKRLKSVKFSLQLSETGIHHALIQYLGDAINTFPQSKTLGLRYVLAALHGLGSSKVFQVGIATYGKSIQFLLHVAIHATKTPEDDHFVLLTIDHVLRNLAIRTLLKMKHNAGTVTPFYMCELGDKQLRVKFRDWIDEFGSYIGDDKWLSKHNSSSNKNISSTASLPTLLDQTNQEQRIMVLHQQCHSKSDSFPVQDELDIHHAKGLSKVITINDVDVVLDMISSPRVMEDANVVIVSRDVKSLITVDMVSGGEMKTEDDLLPAPRSTTATTRVIQKAAWIRGVLKTFKVPTMSQYRPKPIPGESWISPHRFLQNKDGGVKNVPVELVFTLGGQQHSISSLHSMKFLQVSADTFSLEEDENWNLSESVFSARLNPVLDSGKFWDSEKSFSDALNWDLAMIQRKPSFIRKISSKYNSGDIQTAVGYLKSSYPSILMVFNFYNATERVDFDASHGNLNDSVHNIFCLSRNQFYQFLDDNELIELATHMGPEDFDEVFESVVTQNRAPTKEETLTNKETILFKHAKRTATMTRYHFVEAIFLLADAMLVRAPKNHPLKMRYLCRAVLYIVEKCFKNIAAHGSLNADLFRHHNLYRASIGRAFQQNARCLMAEVFTTYAGKAHPRSLEWGGVPGQRMSLLDWVALLDEIGLSSIPGFCSADVFVVFLQSNLIAPDLVQDWRKTCSLTFVGFLESLARLIQYVLLPASAEMKKIGMQTIGEYYDFNHATRAWRFLPEVSDGMKGWVEGESGTKLKRDPDEDEAADDLYDVSKLLSAKQVEAVIELTRSAKLLVSKKELRNRCWNARLTYPEASRLDPDFDVQVAKDLHENMCKARGEITLCDGLHAQRQGYEPLITTIDGKQIDIANSIFEDLPEQVQYKYLISSYLVCQAIRSELLQCRWTEVLENVNMVYPPPMTLPGTETGNPASPITQTNISSPLVRIHFPTVVDPKLLLIHEADAVIFRRLFSRRFHDETATMLYKNYNFRNPDSQFAQDRKLFDGLPEMERNKYYEVVQIGVLRYVSHVQCYWNHREHST